MLATLALLGIGFCIWRRDDRKIRNDRTGHPAPAAASIQASAGVSVPTPTTPAHDASKPADLPAILSSLAGAGSNEPAAEQRQDLLRRWASLHPSDAAQWAEALPAGNVKIESLQHVAILWAQRDAGSARDWARTLPTGEGKETALTAVGYEAAAVDPSNALLAAGELQFGPARHELILHAVNQWATTQPEAALLWAESVQAPGLRDELFAAIATAWAEQDPAAASMLASQAIRTGEPHRRAVVSVLQRWFQTDPEAAGAWVQRIPDPALRSNCWEAIRETGAGPATP
jgi:hypothetical protein